MLLASLLAALLLMQQPVPQADTTAIAPADSAMVSDRDLDETIADVDGARPKPEIRPIIAPSAFYSPVRGFGIGGGVSVWNAARAGDRLHVEGRLTQRYQSLWGSYSTSNPAQSRVYGLIGAGATTTSRHPYYGTSPRYNRDAKLDIDRAALEVEGRVGWAPFGPRTVVFQPTLQFRYDRLRDYAEADGSSIELATPADLRQLDALRDDPRHGVSGGLSVLLDTRDDEVMPRSGVVLQSALTQFVATDTTNLRFTRGQATVTMFHPALFRIPFLPEPGAFFVRANVVVTRQGGEDPLPYMYLPDLDRDLLVGFPRRRFQGRDAASLAVGVRGVVAQVIGAFLVEGMAFGMVGAAYDDISADFTPRVTFDPGSVDPAGRVPLRPSAAVGMNVHFIDRERPLLGVVLGGGPEGLTSATFRIVYPLRWYRPEIR
ncbi:MAG: BamA/TamA family outer membrane protein [Rubricoccaceae bacterium]